MSMRDQRAARTLHPGAWWLWALGLAIVASHTTNPLLLGLIIGVAALVVAARREDAPWARAFRMYLFLGAAIVVIRVGFRILFGGEFGTNILFALPEAALPEWAAGIRIGGEVTAESILAAFVDGLRLATIVICFGAANSLANPGRLLRLAPNALYEAGAAVTVAMSLAPQLAESVLRVGRARRIRGAAAGGRRSVPGILLPVLQDALDRSLSLAASMDARGYGRSGTEPAARHRMTAALLVVGLFGVAIGLYGVLDATAAIPLALPIMVGGVALLVGGMVAAGRRVSRTRYRPDPWDLPEWLVAGCGALAVASVMLGATLEPASLQIVARADLVAGARARSDDRRARRGHPGLDRSAAGLEDGDARVHGDVGGATVIRFDEVSLTYPEASAPTLRDVDLVVEEGSLCLVAGRTGAGKTTLLRLVNGLVPHFTGGLLTGRVTVDGRDTRDHPPRELADVVGSVAQDPLHGFVTDSVEEELAYGMEQLGVDPADDAPARGGDARPARDRRPARPLPAQPFGRSAAARRDRFGARRRATRPHPRRADLGARPARGGGGPRRDPAARARPRAHGPARRAPDGARGRLRGPHRHRPRGRHGDRWIAGIRARASGARPTGRRAGTPGGLVAAAPHRARRAGPGRTDADEARRRPARGRCCASRRTPSRFAPSG